jgi:UDP-N-acetylmuramate--alanine ligase
MFKNYSRIHFVGIGGSGMNGIAEVLLNLGYRVSGSDAKDGEVVQRLAKLGAVIHLGHDEKNVGTAQVVVTSTAVKPDNPEVIYAKAHKIPVIPRIEMLAELARLKYTIAVAGTHGKTSTTSLVATILQGGGLDPTFIIGGRLNHLESGAKLGTGDFLVAEADESDGSFLKLSPAIGIITNIDNDHLDYHGTLAKLKKAFAEFANRIPFYGCMIVCIEDAGVRSILSKMNRRVVTYGFRKDADFSARDIQVSGEKMIFTVFKADRALGTVELKIAGRHNVLNALAAVVCGCELQIPFDIMTHSLRNFENAQRRLELKGGKNGAVWIDDYGHHPTEVRASLSALREKYPKNRIIVAFQPHRYTRTQILYKDFGKSFAGVDEVILLPVYSAGEPAIPGVSSALIAGELEKKGIPAVQVSMDQAESLRSRLVSGTVFVTLGAGDVWKLGEKLFK